MQKWRLLDSGVCVVVVGGVAKCCRSLNTCVVRLLPLASRGIRGSDSVALPGREWLCEREGGATLHRRLKYLTFSPTPRNATASRFPLLGESLPRLSGTLSRCAPEAAQPLLPPPRPTRTSTRSRSDRFSHRRFPELEFTGEEVAGKRGSLRNSARSLSPTHTPPTLEEFCPGLPMLRIALHRGQPRHLRSDRRQVGKESKGTEHRGGAFPFQTRRATRGTCSRQERTLPGSSGAKLGSESTRDLLPSQHAQDCGSCRRPPRTEAAEGGRQDPTTRASERRPHPPRGPVHASTRERKPRPALPAPTPHLQQARCHRQARSHRSHSDPGRLLLSGEGEASAQTGARGEPGVHCSSAPPRRRPSRYSVLLPRTRQPVDCIDAARRGLANLQDRPHPPGRPRSPRRAPAPRSSPISSPSLKTSGLLRPPMAREPGPWREGGVQRRPTARLLRGTAERGTGFFSSSSSSGAAPRPPLGTRLKRAAARLHPNETPSSPAAN